MFDRPLMPATPAAPKASTPRLAALFLAVAACLAGPISAEEAAPAEELAPPEETANPVAELTAQLEEADQAFNRAALERRKDATSTWLAGNAVFFSDVVNRGRDAFLAAWAPIWTGKYDFTYTATSKRAVVADSGELAFTLGEAETRFQHPAESEPNVTDGHYLNVWMRDGDGPWRLRASSTLVVHAEWGAAREPRSALMTAWPELGESLDATIAIEWTPEEVLRAESGELAASLGTYALEVEDGDTRHAGKGHFLAVWQMDEDGHWQLAGEGLTPPDIHAESE